MRTVDLLREVLYTTMVVLLVAGLWVLGYSRAITSQAGRYWWPPKDPSLTRQVTYENAWVPISDDDLAVSSLELSEAE